MAKTPKTPEPEPQVPDEKGAPPLTKEDVRREQEKGDKQPVNPPVEPSKATLVEVDQHEPYPTGSPQDPEAAFEATHGYRRKEGE